MWPYYVAGTTLVFALSLTLGVATAARRRRVRYDRLIREWRSIDDDDQQRRLLESARQNRRTSAVGWYLMGVQQLRAGRTRQAARSFGAAHHGNPNFETAALLTFACLKARDGEDSDILEQIVQTWSQMKRPDVIASSEDRLVSEALTRADEPRLPLSPLGRIAWAVVPAAQRDRLEQLLNDDTCGWIQPFRGGANHR